MEEIIGLGSDNCPAGESSHVASVRVFCRHTAVPDLPGKSD